MSARTRVSLTACVLPALAAQVRAAAGREGASVHAWVRAAVVARLRDGGGRPPDAEALLPVLGRAGMRALDAARLEGEPLGAALRRAVRLLVAARR